MDLEYVHYPLYQPVINQTIDMIKTLQELHINSILDCNDDLINENIFINDSPDIPKYTNFMINAGINGSYNTQELIKLQNTIKDLTSPNCLKSSARHCDCTDCKDNIENVLWMCDSGASDHFTNNMADFKEYYPYAQPRIAETANGIAHILGQGIVTFVHMMLDGTENFVVLNPVVYLPGIRVRLISNESLCRRGYNSYQTRHQITFTCDGSIKPHIEGLPLNDKEDLMWVKSKILILDKTMSQELPATVNRVNYDIWHKRMGHPSLEILKKGPTNLKGFPNDLIYKSKELICPGCALGKMKNRSYPQSTKRATKPFELVHVD